MIAFKEQILIGGKKKKNQQNLRNFDGYKTAGKLIDWSQLFQILSTEFLNYGNKNVISVEKWTFLVIEQKTVV